MYCIDYYKNDKGKCLYDEAIIELKQNGCKSEIKKIEHSIELLKKFGDKLLMNAEHAKKIEYDLCELRPFPNRVLYYHCRFNNKYVILHIFKKKTNKTPIDEIKKGIKEINDYERMIKNER